MIPNRAPSPVDKLALAVVHAPERAMPAPAGAREESLRFLLQTAADAGVTVVATKPDGDGERMLGQSWPFPSPFRPTMAMSTQAGPVRSTSQNNGCSR